MQAMELALYHLNRGETYMAWWFSEVKLKAPRKPRAAKILTTVAGRNKRNRGVYGADSDNGINTPGEFVMIDGIDSDWAAT